MSDPIALILGVASLLVSALNFYLLHKERLP